VKRLSRLVVRPGEAEPFNRCGSRVTAADTIRRGSALYLRPRATQIADYPQPLLWLPLPLWDRRIAVVSFGRTEVAHVIRDIAHLVLQLGAGRTHLLGTPLDEGEIEDDQVVGVVHAHKRMRYEESVVWEIQR
jgi:hypothetical protein